MKTITMKAYAKINLCLDIKGKDAVSGYHLIDTVMQTIDLHDTVILTKREDSYCSSKIIGADIDGDNALKAAKLFSARFDTKGVDIEIIKRIPLMSGLGGSSTDAAAVLKGMAILFNISTSELPQLASNLGSDTVYFLKEGLARCTGRGTEIERIKPLPELYALLITDTSGVSTKDAYELYDTLKAPIPVKVDLIMKNLREFKDTKLLPTNSLMAAAQTLNPIISEQLRALADRNAIMTTMTGSGSAVFSLYTDLDKALEKQRFLMFDSEVYQFVY
ncbi:MAG: 4-(cytidine 5'-diphospho)-2-C-methyl-D-erythritol kinase [Clostridia bacterium]|nr:4-(cytidine 5'-diphospho)-2-C-methyl-D-erythritol kinase [Clostridia bacterium]